MDEISKLVFGCVALVGLVVMIIPNSDPLAPGNAAKPAESAAIPPPPNAPPPSSITPPPPAASQSGSGFAVEDYNIGKFGEPMMDPTPPGQRNNDASQAPNQPQPGFAPPPGAGPQGQVMPPPGQNIPTQAIIPTQ